MEDRQTIKQVDRQTGKLTDRKTDRQLGRHRYDSSEFWVYKVPTTSWLPQSGFYPWESAPRVNILILGAGSQGQDFDSGSRLPGSRFWPWEPAPMVNILILGAGSQGQYSDLGSRLPGAIFWPWELAPRNLGVTCNILVYKCTHISVVGSVSVLLEVVGQQVWRN